MEQSNGEGSVIMLTYSLYLVTQMATSFTPFKGAIGNKAATCITFPFTVVTEMALLDMYSPIWPLL